MKKLSIASLIAFSALSVFAWDNMPKIVADATAVVEANSPADVIKASLEAVSTGVQDPNLDRNKNFEQQENAFIKTWAATEASFYYGNPKMDKSKRNEFVSACVSAYKNIKGKDLKSKEQKIFLLGLMQNCPSEKSIDLLKETLGDKDKDIADAARMALQQNPEKSVSAILAKAKSKDKVLASGLVNAQATRAYDKKAAPAKIKAFQEEKSSSLNHGASLIAAKGWYSKDSFEEQKQKITAKDKGAIRRALESDNSRDMIYAIRFAVEDPSMMETLKASYAKRDDVVKSWVLTALGDTGTPAARDFIINALKETDSDNVRLGGAWALACIGDEQSGLAAIDLHKAVWGNGHIRDLVEYSVRSMKPSKALDNAILEGVKNFDRSCIRLAGARGLTEALPNIVKAIKENKERGDACWAFRELGTMKDFLKFIETAIEINDNWLNREVFQMMNHFSLAIYDTDVAPTTEALDKLQEKAAAKGVNLPWDRMKDLVKYKGKLPRK